MWWDLRGVSFFVIKCELHQHSLNKIPIPKRFFHHAYPNIEQTYFITAHYFQTTLTEMELERHHCLGGIYPNQLNRAMTDLKQK